MKYIPTVICFLITVGIICVLQNRIPLGQTTLPPLGKVLNPFDGFWKNAKNVDAFQDIKIRHERLSAPVDVIFDKRLVPHIFAKNNKDLFFAQGYVEAYLRLFQMDLSARQSEGSLSEIAGSRTLSSDIRMRTLGVHKSAEANAKSWSQSTLAPEIQSYVAGVNHYISELDPSDLPLEFKLMDYRPTPWSLYKSALIKNAMTLTLSWNSDDISRTNTLLHFGKDVYDYLYKSEDPNQRPIIHPSKQYDFKNLRQRTKPNGIDYEGPLLKNLEITKYQKGIGSNNWAIAGSKTKSGLPMLANDPHLPLNLPSIWYEVHLHTPTVNARGVTIPGVGGIVIGFNENIAWGLTNVGHDIKDYYTIEWADEHKTEYWLDGNKTKIKSREEVIKVRDQATTVLDVKETHFGPVYLSTQDDTIIDLAIQWLPLQNSNPSEINTFYAIMSAGSLQDFMEDAANFDVPAQNFLCADRTGNIGLRINGKLPLKYKDEGVFVKKGNAQNNKWTDFLDRNENPKYINPPEGYIGSANQKSAAGNYPYPFNGGFEDFRGRRVYDMIDAQDKMDIESSKRMQADDLNYKASDLLPFLLAELKKQNVEKNAEIISTLKKWDYRYSKESKGATYFELWYKKLVELYLDEFDTEFTMYKPDDWKIIDLIKSRDTVFSDHLKTEEIENINDIIQSSFDSLSLIVDEMDDSSKAWGDYRSLNFNHLLRLPGFGREGIKVGGHPNTLNAISARGFGPSWRMIVAFENDGYEALGVFPGGQSGNPASAYYDNFIDDWKNFNYYNLNLPGSKAALGEDILFEINMNR